LSLAGSLRWSIMRMCLPFHSMVGSIRHLIFLSS
jgi:hypothetical protein